MSILEEELFRFFERDKNNKYLFGFSNGDEFVVEYHSERKIQINSDCSIELVFNILEIRNNISKKYFLGDLIEISSNNYPESIREITKWKIYRKVIINECFDCGGRNFAFYDYPLNLHYICENCGLGPATTANLPITSDDKDYQLTINKALNLTKIQLYKLRKMFNISYVDLQRKFNDGFVYVGKVEDVLYKKIILEEMGLTSKVTPEAEYSYEDVMFAKKNYQRL